jgi:hypothetical protein
MAPQGLIASEAYFIGIRAEQNSPEANSAHASRIPKHYLQQKNEPLTKDKLRQKCILGEVYRKHFPQVQLALLPFQFPKENPSNADPTRAPVNIVLSRSTEARDFERHAPQRGCNFHSPELTVWSEPCHVPSAQQAALAGRKNLF